MYLVASMLVLVAGRGSGSLIAVHAIGAVLALWTIRPARDIARTIGDFLPLIIPPLLYRELPALIAIVGRPFHDASIQRIEAALFGTQPARTFAGALPNLWLSETLHAGYLAYYLLLFVPPLLLYFRGERLGYLRTVWAMTLTMLVCWTIFVIAPVEGPRYLWPAPAGMPDGPMRRLAVEILAAGSSRGAAFPSSHMAVSLILALSALRWQRRVGMAACVVALLIALGAVYGGFHYGTDMIAGALLGLMLWLVVRGEKREAATTPRLPADRESSLASTTGFPESAPTLPR